MHSEATSCENDYGERIGGFELTESLNEVGGFSVLREENGSTGAENEPPSVQDCPESIKTMVREMTEIQ